MYEQGLSTRFSRVSPLLKRRSQADALFADMGFEAHKFLRDFIETQSHIELVPDAPALSTYTPYAKSGFLNKCVFGRDVAEEFVISLVHQGNLALAWSNASVLHANAENPLAPAIPLPEDFVRIAERLAQDTYAKQAWMASKAAKIDPVFVKKTINDPVSVTEFTRWHDTMDLPDALAMAACASMEKTFVKGKSETFADHIHAKVLSLYESQIDWLNDNGLDVRFMRIEDQDIRDIGNTFGPNILLKVQALKPFRMNAENTLHAGRLREKYKIGNDIPAFTESLSKAGLDRVEFLSRCKARRAPQESFTPYPG